MNNKGKMIIISGPSGVGKGSINQKLLNIKELKLTYSISMTTRKPRKNEINGVNYFFVSEEYFANSIIKNELIEYAQFVGNFYGTPKKYVEEKINEGKNVILEIEVDGATQILNKESNVLSIFLMPPNLSELEKRIRGRQTETEEIVKERLNKALLEIPLKHNYNYIVENDNIENAVAKISDILHLENLTDLKCETMYSKLKKNIKEIVEEKYMYFVKNWYKNIVILMRDQNELDKIKDFNAKENLINILTDKLYRKVLSHGDFNNLDNKEYVMFKLQKLMFQIDFFSIEQSNWKKCY